LLGGFSEVFKTSSKTKTLLSIIHLVMKGLNIENSLCYVQNVEGIHT